jgi:hypothetical protein
MFELSKVKEQLLMWRKLHWNRFVWNCRPYNLWYNDVGNPYLYAQGKERTAREDWAHSYVNLFVEFQRDTAYLVGHITMLIPPALIIGGIVWLS